MPANVTIATGGQQAAPLDYQIPGAVELVLVSLKASYDGSGAGGSFVPTVQLLTATGVEVGSYALGQTLAAGASADVTWFPGVSGGASSGLDTTDGTTTVNPTSELLIGTNLVLSNPSAGVAQIAAKTGSTFLLYDYTVTGAAKTTIDTDVDGPFAGLFPTNFTYLEVYLTGRTTEAVHVSDVNCFFNNDLGANYVRTFVGSAIAGSPIQGQVTAGLTFAGVLAGGSATAGVSGLMRLFIPNYTTPTFYKICEFTAWSVDTVAGSGNYQVGLEAALYTSTAPVTRISFTPAGDVHPGAQFAVGTRLSVWAR